MIKSLFSEREFEWAFNREFFETYRQAIIEVPRIPNQRREAYEGIDVEFQLKVDDCQYSLFLQHKISDFMEKRTRKNYQIFDLFNGPYFSFTIRRLDRSQQHNLLYSLAHRGEYVYYSSPEFFTRESYRNFLLANEIMDNTIFIDPGDIGFIADFEQHKVIFRENDNLVHCQHSIVG